MTSTIRDQYEIIQEIGSGGMGKVYQARDRKLNRLVALKVLLPDSHSDASRQRRFLLEAQAASALNHPNIITIYDILSDQGSEIMVMEYVPGKTLAEAIPRGGLRVPQVINYGVQIADALAAAHAAGIVHRDLKPGNIMVTDRGFVKILDFGLAKLAESTLSEDPDVTRAAPLTIEGSILGTLCYMSPEQAQGKPADARSDIFSFGAVLYEMATGQRAFSGDNPISMLTAVLRDDPRSSMEIVGDIPPQLDQLIRRCLQKNPDERWATMEEVHQVLLALKHGSDSGSLYNSRLDLPTMDLPPSSLAPLMAPAPAPPPPAVSRKPPVAIIAAVLAVVVLLASGVGWWAMHKGSGVPPPPQQAVVPANPVTPDKPSPVTETPKPSPIALTNQSVLDLFAAKASVPFIISQIRSSPSNNFDLSSAEVIRLLQQGVPESVIEVMRNPKGPAPATSSAGASGPTGSIPTASPTASTPVAPANAKIVTLADGTPIRVALSEDVPNDAEPGSELTFKVLANVEVDGQIVIPRGALARGTVLERKKKKMLLLSSKPTFDFIDVKAVNNQPVKLRATSQAAADGGSGKVLEFSGQKPKNIAAPKGTLFVAYVEGAQKIPLP